MLSVWETGGLFVVGELVLGDTVLGGGFTGKDRGGELTAGVWGIVRIEERDWLKLGGGRGREVGILDCEELEFKGAGGATDWSVWGFSGESDFPSALGFISGSFLFGLMLGWEGLVVAETEVFGFGEVVCWIGVFWGVWTWVEMGWSFEGGEGRCLGGGLRKGLSYAFKGCSDCP